MDTKEITVSDLAQEQIRNAERLFPLIREKTKERKEKKTVISVSAELKSVYENIAKEYYSNTNEKRNLYFYFYSGWGDTFQIYVYPDTEDIKMIIEAKGVTLKEIAEIYPETIDLNADVQSKHINDICKFNNLSKVNLWRKLSEEEKLFIHSKFPDCVIEESTED